MQADYRSYEKKYDELTPELRPAMITTSSSIEERERRRHPAPTEVEIKTENYASTGTAPTGL